MNQVCGQNKRTPTPTKINKDIAIDIKRFTGEQDPAIARQIERPTNIAKRIKIKMDTNTMIVKQQETMIEQQKEKYKDTVVWIDIETTGTDPKHDSILQIALIIADKDFNAIEEYEWIVKHRLMDVLSQADDYVKEMHTKTGLWKRIEREGLPLTTIDSHIYSILSKVYDGWKISIGGNSVHFDMNFLTAQLKKSGQLISHRVLDISAVLQYFRVIGDKVELPKHTVSHDAIDDIRWSLTQAKAIKEKINGK